MTDKPVNLDHHHGMSAQKATDLRRLRAEVEANEQALRLRQEEPENQLIAAAALDWAIFAQPGVLSALALVLSPGFEYGFPCQLPGSPSPLTTESDPSVCQVSSNQNLAGESRLVRL